MREWNIHLVINQFDRFCKNIDFKNLPDRQSEEYRLLVLKTANDVIFADGRYSNSSEMTLELFDVPQINKAICDLKQLNALTADERVRLAFYLDLKEVCYPLFRAQEIDWTAWPWQLESNGNILDNQPLFDLITDCQWPNLSAAICYTLQDRLFGDDEHYSSVARNEISEAYTWKVSQEWKEDAKDEEKNKKLIAAINDFASDLWEVENHMQVGRQLGFDIIAQSVYDAFDTYIDSTYRYHQVNFARALATWIHENWTIGERHPDKDKVKALDDKMKELMAKYHVESPNMSYTWNLITLDALGMSMFSKEEEESDDADDWGED